jgi:cell division protein FtsB
MSGLLAIEIAGIILGCIVALGLAVVYLSSRYRRAADAEKDKYIAALEQRNQHLEKCQEELRAEQQLLRDEVKETKGQLAVLTDLVMRQCRHAEIDLDTGGCRYCSRGLYYGEDRSRA